MSTKEILSGEQETIRKDRKEPNYGLRRKVGATILIGASVLGLWGLGKTSIFDKTINPSIDPGIDSPDTFNVEATSVIIEEGANVRYAPFVPNQSDGNTKITTMKSDTVITAPLGEHITIANIDRPGNQNDWISINTAYIHTFSNNSQLLKAADKDNSGTVWVNLQKADYTTSLDDEIN